MTGRQRNRPAGRQDELNRDNAGRQLSRQSMPDGA